MKIKLFIMHFHNQKRKKIIKIEKTSLKLDIFVL